MYEKDRFTGVMLAGLACALVSACASKEDSPGCVRWGEPRQEIAPDGFRYMHSRCVQWSRAEPSREAKLPYEAQYPLHWAMSRADVGRVRSLLASGASLDGKDAGGRVPIQLLKENYPESQTLAVLQLVKEHGQDLSAAREVMASAIPRHHAEIVAFVVANGADINHVSPGDGPRSSGKGTGLDQVLAGCTAKGIMQHAVSARSIDNYTGREVRPVESYQEARGASCRSFVETLRKLGAKTASELATAVGTK